MSKIDDDDEENNNKDNDNDSVDDNECYYESLDRIVSSSCSCSNSNSDNEENDTVSFSASPNHGSVPKFPMGTSNKYDVWISQPSSVSERRSRLLRQMGLSNDPSLSRDKPARDFGFGGDIGRSVSSDRLTNHSSASTMVRSKSDGSDRQFDVRPTSTSVCAPPVLSTPSSSPSVSLVNNNDDSYKCNHAVLVKARSGNSDGESRAAASPNKPPIGKSSSKKVDEIRGNLTVGLDVNFDSNAGGSGGEVEVEGLDCNGVGRESEKVCLIKNLDNGKEFVVNEIREDGTWNKLKEVGTGRQLTMEEFEMSVGHSPIVQELMRRQNVEEGNKDSSDSNANGVDGSGAKMKKKGSWFKSIRSVASSVTGQKERRSSDERDTSSEKGGRRSSSATDDSQDVSFHGPERVKVRQYGKSCKELTALYKSQEIRAHNGSIWSIKFSLDGKYLASAGEDCVIHVWQVVESDRKGDLLMDKPDDGNMSLFFVANGSPEPTLLSPSMDNHPEKKRRGRSSMSRKSLSLDHVVVPETVFSLSEKPICSFRGHLDDVLDLSWSKSQHLLSSSMDKTVRLWHLSSEACLKIFSHSDYVTCIQFNPVDDRYFISGSLDAKVRIWSIPDRQVVDWNDVHEMVTAACYTPDGQGALVGSYKGSCRLYNTSENKLQQKNQINLQNKKKKSNHKKITGFQFAPGSSSEVLITSADSRIRVVDSVDLVHKFKGFRNQNSQISASLTSNGKYVVSASEDSCVFVWKHEADSRPNRSKGVTVTHSYEHFHCQDVSAAIPWPGLGDSWGLQDNYCREQNGLDNNLDEVSTANHPPTPVEEINGGSQSASGCSNSPLHGTISSATNSYFFDRISATWPEEKLLVPTRNRSSPRVSVDFFNGVNQNVSAWGLVIITAGLRGEIRTFQNFGLPVRI
ncbi:WD repeat-containing protein 44-like [Juglans microcarpa x Juglans regia]|uniref:WD repeat-containing protein 44-like n=1 Tax=Juglans microcarpa x Juglans regia TaxID=2249226 RepID=UPI001B7DDBF5|nr:WD repeat-containing protein 44-like [Juglans microcarpa x Juglans regia]